MASTDTLAVPETRDETSNAPSKRGSAFWLTMLALIVSTFLSVLDLTAIGTALPTIIADLNGGEDFSWYLEEVPGAMARLGVWSGEGPQLDLHQPTFDLDERALGVGVRTMVNLVEQSAAF